MNIPIILNTMTLWIIIFRQTDKQLSAKSISFPRSISSDNGGCERFIEIEGGPHQVASWWLEVIRLKILPVSLQAL
ncbi:hypothetical protein [uncultured Gimesia sp.]|uniref:hypothetical protein n=1 Tax=uncultured Gimesia sp. TaxID=1678688 RepID=UPI00262BDCAC|nr:hypothetical protein [uncultured Gimesia sp.]